MLNYGEQEDTFKIYRLIDILFEAFGGNEEMSNGDGFSLTNVELHIERVLDRLET